MNSSLLSDRLWPSTGGALTRNAVLAIAGSLIVAAAAQINVPMLPVPMTLQTLAVLAIGAAYGARLGAITLALYALEGAAGLPVFAEFKSVISQVPTAQQIIPAAAPAADASPGGATAVYEYEPEPGEILADLIPRNIAVQIFRALLENAAGEMGARMSAMDNATRNAGDLINKMTIIYNRTRQAAITTELIEIIAGAEAL